MRQQSISSINPQKFSIVIVLAINVGIIYVNVTYLLKCVYGSVEGWWCSRLL